MAADLFNEQWYLEKHPDVLEAVQNGLITAREHFEQFGKYEGRTPGPLFDPKHYLAGNPDVAAAVEAGMTSAYDHFLLYGAHESRNPVVYFDADFYLQQNPDIAEAVQAGIISATEHFLLYGQTEVRAISPFFDLAGYLSANPDVATAVEAGMVSPLEHLLLAGFAEGRDLGNGVSLAQFHNDPTFQHALAEGGNVMDALARVAEVAPFLPTFQPPAGWQPPAHTPIPVDFVPEEGTHLVIPPSVVVPDDMELPDTFDPVAPAPDPQPEPGPTSQFEAQLVGGIVSFVSQGVAGHVVVTISENDDGYNLQFTRGTFASDVLVSKEQLGDIKLDWATIGKGQFKPGENTALVMDAESSNGRGKLSASIQEALGMSEEHGTVLVGPGAYDEDVVLTKAGVRVLGPNADIDPNSGARVREAVLSPSRENDDETELTYVVTSTHDAVGAYIAGFTIKGDLGEGAHPMQSGISVESGGTFVKNNIIEDFNYIGVRVNRFTYDKDTQKWAIHLVEDVVVENNKISNVLLDPENDKSVGHAIYYQGALGSIHGNTVLNSETGIQIQPYGRAYNPDLYGNVTGAMPSVKGNTIEAAYRGIWLNYTEKDAPLWTVTDNSITAAAGEADHSDWQGIWIQTFNDGAGYIVKNNSIDGSGADGSSTYGVRFTGIKGDPALLSVEGNAFFGVDGEFYNANGGVLKFGADNKLSLFTHVQGAVNSVAEQGDEQIILGPDTFTEAVNVAGVKGDLLITSLGEERAVVSAGSGTHAIRADGEFFGEVTVAGLEIVTGSQGGVVQFMSASGGAFHVLNNQIISSQHSYAAHGNAIQISGQGSTVIGNEVEAARYITGNPSWSTSGITVVKHASDSKIINNTVIGVEGSENSVIGIAVDAHWSGGDRLTGIEILDNDLSKLSSAISISDRVEGVISGNAVKESTNGIRLGETESGWVDELNVGIKQNDFDGNQRSIAILDFDGGGIVTIEENKFDVMEGAIWLNGSGTYTDAKVRIDLRQFSLEEGLATGVVISDSAELTKGFTIIEDEGQGEYHVTWGEGPFDNLTIVLTGASEYGIEDIQGFFGIEAGI